MRKKGEEKDVGYAELDSYVNDSDALVRIGGASEGEWMWRRIWIRTGKMGITPRVQVFRRVSLGLDHR